MKSEFPKGSHISREGLTATLSCFHCSGEDIAFFVSGRLWYKAVMMAIVVVVTFVFVIFIAP